MAHSSRWIPAFAALASAFPLLAQSGLVCSTSAAVTPTQRHEGFTEQTGDILLTCFGAPGSTPTPAGFPIPQADVVVSLSAPVTSRILGGASPEFLTDALLLVDDPSPANQTPCLAPTDPATACQVLGDGGQTFNKPGKFNVFEGLDGSDAPSPNSITFLGVPVDPPASGVRTFRITNVRIDGTQVAIVLGGLSPVTAFVSASPATSILISNPQDYVGFVADGLVTTITSANAPFVQCLTYPTTNVGTATFTETFATAFKVKTNGVQNVPGEIYDSESGLELSLGGLQAGYADTGTRLQTLISNIPSGVTIYVDNWAASTVSECPEVCSDATLATGPGTPVDPGHNTVTQVTNGTQSSVLVQWEVTNTNSFALDSITLNIYASLTGTTAANQSVAALSGFSPQLSAWSSSGPIPEFSSTVNVAASPTNLFTIAPCPAISGQVTLSGNGLSGVALTLSGSESGSATTNSSGDYSFAVPAGGNYTVTPSLAGYTFTPPSQSFNSLSGSETANFTAQTASPTLSTLYSFPGGSGGAYPYGGVVVGGGEVLYGAASADGASNHGTAFSLTPPGSSGGPWTPALLYTFSGGTAGSDPQTGVVVGKGGVLYGTAGSTVYSLTPPGSSGGAWTEAALSSSTGGNGLALGSGGVLYGTTAAGGAYKLGSVFSLTPPVSGSGPWTETLLYSFTGGSDINDPQAGVVVGKGGVLYGTTYAGGPGGYGGVYSLTPPAAQGGVWSLSQLYTFSGGSGAHPKGVLAVSGSGVLYGVTYYGGTSGLGTVFSLTAPKPGTNKWVKNVLYNFTGAKGDGAYPFAGVTIGAGGVLFGTTVAGGSSTACNSGKALGCGTVYSLAPPAAPGGPWTETVLYSFTGEGDGSDPQAGVVIGNGGVLYGTTVGGGASNNGTVFSVKP